MKPSVPRSISLPLVFAISACAREEKPAVDTVATVAKVPAPPAAVAARVSQTPGFKTPESVRYDADQDVFFVSNINGNPSQKDGNGFISRMRGDSTSVVTMFVEGGKNGVTLNGPKGMAIVGDTLWVADIDAVRAFDRHSGKPIASIDLRPLKATFLNDVVAGPDGAIYITDSGILFDAKGVMTHPGVDRIFRITGRTASVALASPALAGPNGIAWDAAGNRFLLAPFAGKDLQAWTPGDTTLTTVATGPGGYDGLEVNADMGGIIVTSWADSAVHVVSGSSMTRVATGVEAPADIGIDTKRHLLAIPRFNAGIVELWRMK